MYAYRWQLCPLYGSHLTLNFTELSNSLHTLVSVVLQMYCDQDAFEN